MATHSKKDEESRVQHVLPLGVSRSNCTIIAASSGGDLHSYQGEPKMWKGSKRCQQKIQSKKWQIICCKHTVCKGAKPHTTWNENHRHRNRKMCCFRDLWFDKCASLQMISEIKQILPQYISVRTPPTMYKTIKTRARLWQGRGNMSSLFSLDCCCCCVWDFTFQGKRQGSSAH